MPRVAAVIQQDLRGFVSLPDECDLSVGGVRLAEVGAQPALSVVYSLHRVAPWLMDATENRKLCTDRIAMAVLALHWNCSFECDADSST